MRLEQLRQHLAAEELQGFLVSQPENRRYLSGFTGSAGVLLITADKQILATDSRYYTQVGEECPDWQLAKVGYGFKKAMAELFEEHGLAGQQIGFEAKHVTVSTLKEWEEALDGKAYLIGTENVVEELRMQKDEAEIARLKKAITLADETWTYIANWMQPGMSEQQVAWEMEVYMRTHGASALSFETIVASGPNSAKPHAQPGDRLLREGEPITIDFGCVVDGYCSDITRTICLGEPDDDRYLAVWNTVLKAQQAAEEGAKAGMTGEAIDKLARDIINEAGYEEYFGHGLGHGVGLAIHEGPRFSFTYPDEIPAGAVVTVEPGIYIPGWGGVRIEDIVVVREDKVEVLTEAPKHAVLSVSSNVSS